MASKEKLGQKLDIVKNIYSAGSDSHVEVCGYAIDLIFEIFNNNNDKL